MAWRRTAVLTALGVTLGGAAGAATPQAYAELDRRSAAACVAASGFRQASVGEPVRFSDTVGVDARVVSGVLRSRT